MDKIAFIGGGNMASAVIGGLLKSGRAAQSVIVVEPFETQRDKLLADFDIRALAAADASLAQAALVVWAVKPQLFKAVAPGEKAQIEGLLAATGQTLPAPACWATSSEPER